MGSVMDEGGGRGGMGGWGLGMDEGGKGGGAWVGGLGMDEEKDGWVGGGRSGDG